VAEEIMNKLVLVVGLAACADKQAPPKVSITDADLAAVNAAVPADMKGKIEFEIGVVTEEKGRNPTKYKMVRPKGWKPGFMPGSLEPADGDKGFGSPTLGKTSMDVGSNCDGRCEEKDWAKVSDKVNFASFVDGKRGEGKVVKDVKGKNTRTLVFEHKLSENWPEKDVAFTIVTAWWTDGGEKYFVCDVELGAPAKGLVDAFEKVCAKVSGD
jgi:hypothetical protein